MQGATSTAAIVANTDTTVVEAFVGEKDPIGQMNNHVPWQMKWKHPQFTSSSPAPADKRKNETGSDDVEVVGISSARLSPFEISQLLSFGNPETDIESKTNSSGNESHYLLTVTLLGRPVGKTTMNNDYGGTTCREMEKYSKPLAVEVLLEALDISSSNPEPASDETKIAPRVIRTKRLRWPQSIFDVTFTNDSRKNAVATKASRIRKRTKRKNLLASVLLPLMGIDEEDEYSQGYKKSGFACVDEARKASAKNLPAPLEDQEEPTVGIVAATLCRRPNEDLLANSKTSVTKDIVELMSFGSESDGLLGATISHAFERGAIDRAKKNDSEQVDYNHSDEIPSIARAPEQEKSRLRRKKDEREVCGELSFVCISQSGEIFVYDPLKLLLGIDDEADLRDGERNAKKSLEDASSFFFGEALFQNLEKTWKPLAEPSTRIHLSLFEHGHKNQRRKTEIPGHPFENYVQSNKDISDLAQSILSKDNKSIGSPSKEENHEIGGERSIMCGESTKILGSNDSSDSSTAVTSATDALAVVQTMAIESQTGVEDALSLLPYLLNPLLEPSTLKDRTAQNKPFGITVTGNSYLVVTGWGLKRKKKQTNFTRSRMRRNNASSSISRDSASDNSNKVYLSPHGSLGEAIDPNDRIRTTPSRKSRGDANMSEQKILESHMEEIEGDCDGYNAISSSSSDHVACCEYDSSQEHNNTNIAEGDSELVGRNKIGIDEFTGNDRGREKDDMIFQEDLASDDGSDISNLDERNGNEMERASEIESFCENDIAVDRNGNIFDGVQDVRKPSGRNGKEVESASEKDTCWKTENRTYQEGTSSITASKNATMDVPNKDDDDPSQRHYCDGYNNDCEMGDTQNCGGFVTFLSTARWSETRTLFLPFVPLQISHISKWNGMELLWVIGEFKNLLIRMDSSGPVPVKIGNAVFGEKEPNNETDLFQALTLSSRTTITDNIRNGNDLSHLCVKKFQVLPIDLGVQASIPPRLLCASTTCIDPPSILELHVSQCTASKSPIILERDNETYYDPRMHARHQELVVSLKSLDYCTPQGTVVLRHVPSHVAKITVDHESSSEEIDNSVNGKFLANGLSFWAEQGQGWSLIGSNRHIHFICWEGSTLLQGAYVQELKNSPHLTPFKPLHGTRILPLPMARDTSMVTTSLHLPNKGIDTQGKFSERDPVFENPQRFSSSVSKLSFLNELQPSLSQNISDNSQYCDSVFPLSDSGAPLHNSLKSHAFSRRQNREYLLQQCSSWTQLEDSLNDRALFEKQEPVLCFRNGKVGSSHYLLSLRKAVVDNGKSSPFQQILVWLAKTKNFFVAAGIALDLLQDTASLYHLWKNAEMIDEEDEETKLVGLLDGITSASLLDDNQKVILSEMTVGCFIKGGASMAKTLQRFLEYNKSYDPARVSLMLSITVLDLFSNHSLQNRDFETLNSGNSHEEDFYEEVLWPIKCLLNVGTKRGYIDEVLTLLNNTIPDELRNRHHGKGIEENKSTHTLTLTKKLIQSILKSDPLALKVLMGFVDDRSDITYWQSLDHTTRLALSLMNIGSSFPFLRHFDARAWARAELDSCFREESNLQTPWLQELSLACLRNAWCDLDDLRIVDGCDDSLLEYTKSDLYNTTSVNDTRSFNLGKPNIGYRDNPIQHMKFEFEKIKNALLRTPYGGSMIDHDLLIPTLLLLGIRNAHWLPPSPISSSSAGSSRNQDLFTSTQSLLNVVCYLAGRPQDPNTIGTTIQSSVDSHVHSADEVRLFAEFDGKTTMKQCYLANNVVAGAYLIGGKNGFILHVCDVLNRGIGLSIFDAQSLLLNDRLDLKKIEESKANTASFKLTDGHRKLLMLLDEHVMSVKTFGEFDNERTRGRVDPVFAARSILRAWLSLNLDDKVAASSWLGGWLVYRLEIRTRSLSSASVATANDDNPSLKTKSDHSIDANDVDTNHLEKDARKDIPPNKYRLACASLVRSLLWPNNKRTPKDKVSYTDVNGHGDSSLVVDYDSMPLAATMGFEMRVVTELCQSCVGLVESVPPMIVRELNI